MLLFPALAAYDFHRFWPRLTDSIGDCSAAYGPIWLKFYEVDGLGYGYELCEFHWGVSRYSGAAAEKPAKTDDFRRFLPVFQPLLLRTSTHPDKICIVGSHTLARLPHKILAKSAHRQPGPKTVKIVGRERRKE